MVRNSAITCDERAARRQAHRHRVCSRGARAWHALDGRGGGTLVNLVDGARNQVPSVQRVRGRFKNRVMLLVAVEPHDVMIADRMSMSTAAKSRSDHGC